MTPFLPDETPHFGTMHHRPAPSIPGDAIPVSSAVSSTKSNATNAYASHGHARYAHATHGHARNAYGTTNEHDAAAKNASSSHAVPLQNIRQLCTKEKTQKKKTKNTDS